LIKRTCGSYGAHVSTALLDILVIYLVILIFAHLLLFLCLFGMHVLYGFLWYFGTALMTRDLDDNWFFIGELLFPLASVPHIH
jgi:hypothetical protein